MFEFHGWFALLDSTYEVNEGKVELIVWRLQERIGILGWKGMSSFFAEVRPLNGTYFLFIHGNPNHKGYIGLQLDDLLAFVTAEAPGSYGVMYWRNSEEGTNDFTVKIMTRGKLVDHPDPFLSPVIPTIEDDEPPFPEDEETTRFE